MKTSIVIEDQRTQLVLEPETEHDKAVLTVLEKLPNTHRIDWYHTRGGWTYAAYIDAGPYGTDKRKALAIVFNAPVSKAVSE